MINRLTNCFPDHEIKTIEEENCYIIDHKQDDGGIVEIHNAPQISNAVYLSNPNTTALFFDGFPENAFAISPGNHLKQCECVVFPQSCQNDDWVLFMETKYAFNIEIAFREEIDYPNCMIKQIIETVDHFREIGVIPVEKLVNAIVSFPNLINDFSAFFFTNTPSINDIFLEHRIKIRATNVATIRNRRKIYIGELKTFGAGIIE